MKKNEGLLIIEQKVDDFYKHENIYLSKTFQETEARNRFIDPFFTALGWELEQTKLNRQFWDVHREFSQRDDSSTKKPDYAFRINENNKFKEKFFVEAKAPWVPLTDAKPVFQAKRYSFSSHGKAPLVILTDFQEFRCFNGLERPRFDNPLQGLIKNFDLKYTDYQDKWDFLWENFSKEAVYDGSIDRLIGKVSKSTKTLDDEFLIDITDWRETLARNVAIRNKNLSVDEINEAVQRILDRFVFIRNLEDRNIEDENLLFNLVNRKDDEDAHFYKCITPVFRKLDNDYNGLLFKKHFSEDLEIDNKVIKDIIKNMCYPVSPFQFDIIEPEILGRIYERFLGSKIRLTDDHRAKVEMKPEVNHAGGVFYTPEYIVKYIVENTVGEKVKGKTLEEIEQLKILDPACGSGSFLLGAYDYLIEFHKKYYAENQKSRKYKDDFFVTPDGEIRLTIQKKGRILKNNIFGVDIDREATEVAIMSLYLKLLDEGFDKGQAMLFMKGHILPDMTGNIKCGNSLIESDYFDGMLDIQDDEWKNIRPFDWKKEFDNIKFDIIIGNPPYIRIQELNVWASNQVTYYNKRHKTAGKGNYDIYVLFIERGLQLLNQTGLLGYILPHKFFNAQYGDGVRKLISDGSHLKKLVHFGSEQVFDNATTYTCLLFLNKNPQLSAEIIKPLNIEQWRQNNAGQTGIIENSSLGSGEWNFTIGKGADLLLKLAAVPNTLESVTDRIFQGLKTSFDKIYILEERKKEGDKILVYSRHKEQEYMLENALLHPLIKGGDSRKFAMNRNTGLLILFPYCSVNGEKVGLISENVLKTQYPLTYDYLKECKADLEARENNKMKGQDWFAFGRSQALDIINQPKIFTPDIAPFASYSLDEDGEIFFTGGAAGGYGILVKDGIDREYILGLLNSRLLDWCNKQTATSMRGGWFSFESRFIKSLPIILPVDNRQTELAGNISTLVKNLLESNKKKLTVNSPTDLDFMNKKTVMMETQIDKLVYELYGLTEEEIKVVEG